jgi:hypothetical protein
VPDVASVWLKMLKCSSRSHPASRADVGGCKRGSLRDADRHCRAATTAPVASNVANAFFIHFPLN